MKSPTIGLIVLFALAASHVEAINDQRARSEGALRGNSVTVGQIVPLVVTQVWSDEMINGKALLDGNDSLWITSAHHSASPREGTWHFQCEEAPAVEEVPAPSIEVPAPETPPVPLPDVAQAEQVPALRVVDPDAPTDNQGNEVPELPAEEEPSSKEFLIRAAKTYRKGLDDVLQLMKGHRKYLTEPTLFEAHTADHENHGEAVANHVLAIRATEDAIMRLGMVLKNTGNPNPYPTSYDPSSTKVEPTADGLTL